jgi:single-stranded-DNA-specific exonuclease
VAIGLIADLVELRGDCRYLAQRGIQQLQKQSNPATVTRPGVAKLLEYCQQTGDRPTDISFGLGPRINAVSRIQGTADFCIELLTSQDEALCAHLAEATELANTRRKALQKDVMQQVINRLATLDLSTTSVIVLADEQWQVGVLGLVAGQIAQEYSKPTILLNLEGDVARGSARSVNNIDLYQLVKDQAHLLTKFGGHPYAAGLAIAAENLPLFAEAINQQLRRAPQLESALSIDLVVTVAELGKELFQALKLLEPYGMGNPIPRLLIENCRFENVWNKKLKDRRGNQVEYIKTDFELRDDSSTAKFAGSWWGHYKEEIPSDRCDAVVELDFNAYKRDYEVRLIAVRARAAIAPTQTIPSATQILDWRSDALAAAPIDENILIMTQCPTNWAELQAWFRRSQQAGKPLAIAYAAPVFIAPAEIWTQLVGVAKYLSRTGNTATRQQVLTKLGISDRALQFGFRALTILGFRLSYQTHALQVDWQSNSLVAERELTGAIEQFFSAIKEEQFHRQYFYQVPLTTIQAMAQGE